MIEILERLRVDIIDWYVKMRPTVDVDLVAQADLANSLSTFWNAISQIVYKRYCIDLPHIPYYIQDF